LSGAVSEVTPAAGNALFAIGHAGEDVTVFKQYLATFVESDAHAGGLLEVEMPTGSTVRSYRGAVLGLGDGSCQRVNAFVPFHDVANLGLLCPQRGTDKNEGNKQGIYFFHLLLCIKSSID
jgi:hypothetical protein